MVQFPSHTYPEVVPEGEEAPEGEPLADPTGEDLPEDQKVGGVLTAIDVWLKSILFQTAVSTKIGNTVKEREELGDYDLELLKAYAVKAQAAGKAWALGLQKHTYNTSNWQYVHDSFAHFYEDVMVHGHPETYDDALLESGNHVAKVGKRLLFWGGTNETDATYEQTRSTGKRDAQGNLITKTVTKRANTGIEAQHIRNTFCKQTLEMARGSKVDSEAVLETKRAKSEGFNAGCEATSSMLAQFADVAVGDEDEDQAMPSPP